MAMNLDWRGTKRWGNGIELVVKTLNVRVCRSNLSMEARNGFCRTKDVHKSLIYINKQRLGVGYEDPEK